MHLYITRHGQTKENVSGILQGRTPGNLNEKGFEQARLLGEALRNKDITAIHSSDLDRAIDTALIISDLIGAVLVPESSLRERNLGILEGKSWDEYFKAQEKSGLSHLEYKPEGGESILDIQIRVKPILLDLTNGHQRGNILIMGHGGLNTILLDMLLPMPLAEIWEIGQSNACINRLEVMGSMETRAIILNDTKHLAASDDTIE
ncbi:MAG: histidine phosphatase family protein [Candidatus Marinimicrobia bacterium]|nr:histidine phosphatase family protein [Candidatus Neomarinimicrobiota bacterium]